jgi:hypothetical protein
MTQPSGYTVDAESVTTLIEDDGLLAHFFMMVTQREQTLCFALARERHGGLLGPLLAMFWSMNGLLWIAETRDMP